MKIVIMINQFKNLINNKYARSILFLVVFIITFILRSHEYDRVPTAGHLDEQLYALSGINLIETGVPVSWSTLEYPKRAEYYKGEITYRGGAPSSFVTLYKPWLDEPPLFSLLVGSFAHYYKADRMGFVPVSYIRLPVVIISSLTSILIFLVAKRLTGFTSGIVAMMFFGLTPTFLIGSRTAMPENVIALFLMFLIFMLLKYKDKKKFRYLFPIPLMIGIAGLCKPTGFFLLPLALYLTVKGYDKKRIRIISIFGDKRLWFLILATIPFILGYFIYGYYFDWEIFKKIFSNQSMRPVGFGSLPWLLISPSFATTIFKDGWYVFALISGIYFIFRPKKALSGIISFSLVYWFLVIMFTGGEGDLLAWYRYPLFPLLSITASWGLIYLVKKADFFATFLTTGLLLGNRPLLVTSLNENIKPIMYRISLTSLMLPSVIQSIVKNITLKRISKLIIIGAFILGGLINLVYIYNAFDIICEGMKCPIVPSTFLSRLYFPFFWRFLVINTTP